MSTERSAGRGSRTRALLSVFLPLILGSIDPAPAQDRSSEEGAPPSTITTEVDAGEQDSETPRRKLIKWNEFDGPYSTFRFGFGLLADFASYEQDENSAAHFDMPDDTGVRDFRVLFFGKLKTERPITWSAGIMWDGADEVWRARQTGFMIGIPEVRSRVFIGRTKEGYSMIKLMTGYFGWTLERSTALDAFVPILADGVKWMYHNPERRTFFSLGYFMDALSEEEGFSTYDQQIVGRFGYQALLSKEAEEVLHLAVMGRYGDPDEGSLRTRSRPEAYLSPFLLDTGTIAADAAATAGFEVFYRKGSWMLGTEHNWQEVDAVTGESPLFYGGDAVVTWLVTGETRPYNASGAYFGAISPGTSVFDGGPGAVEAVLRVSYSDFTDPGIDGGKFWRVTPMVNWYLSDQLRLEFAYGYGELDRFGVTGATQFFQIRFQFVL